MNQLKKEIIEEIVSKIHWSESEYKKKATGDVVEILIDKLALSKLTDDATRNLIIGFFEAAYVSGYKAAEELSSLKAAYSLK